jgi:putative pyoverdin transport system ATP-binding/permease protein
MIALWEHLQRTRSKRVFALAIAAGVVSGLSSAGAIALLPAAAAAEVQSALWFAGVALLAVVSKTVSEVLLARLGQQIIASVRTALSHEIVEASFGRVQALGVPRLMAALHDDAATISQACVLGPLLCVNAATVLGCLVYLGWLSWSLLGFVLSIVAAGAGVFRLQEARATSHFERARQLSDALFDHFRGLTSGIKELKMHRERRAAFMERELGASIERYRGEYVGGMVVYSAASSFATALFYVAVGGTAFVWAGRFGLSTANASGATLALLYMMGPLALVVESLPVLSRARVALSSWTELRAELAPQDPVRTVVSSPDSGFERLELQSLALSYPPLFGEPGFRVGPIDFALHRGEIVFLVGGNGSGKTTLSLLLAGLYEAESGEIRVDGERVDGDAYRQLFSAVFSDFHLFPRQLDLSADETLERARHYISRLQLERKVALVDGELEVGGLSQGQKKRLALLIALLEDRPIYLFDEWAADQDPQFRRVFYREVLPELRARGKAVFAVTHDEQYFGVADRCLRMDFGILQVQHTAAALTVQG